MISADNPRQKIWGNGHWQEDGISWDFSQGGYPKPRSRGKTQEEGSSKSGGGPDGNESQGDKRAG